MNWIYVYFQLFFAAKSSCSFFISLMFVQPAHEKMGVVDAQWISHQSGSIRDQVSISVYLIFKLFYFPSSSSFIAIIVAVCILPLMLYDFRSE